jgi:hypothetical protein
VATLYQMALGRDPDPERSFLDDWIAEQGEDAIAAMAKQLERGVADGTVPVFHDKASFLAYYRQRRPPV